MDVTEVPAGSIVVGIDGSPWSEGALDWATDQAGVEHRALIVVHAIPSMGAQSTGVYSSSGLDFVRGLDEARAYARSLLDSVVARALVREPQLVVHAVLVVSDPRSVLLDLAERAWMLVLGSRGRGPVASLLLGSVSVSVATHAACPVVVRRAEMSPPENRILVGVDGTDHSPAAIEFAYRMASFRRSTLTVLHCFWTAGPVGVISHAFSPDLSAEQALVAESLAGMAEKFPDVEVSVRLVQGLADQLLIAASPDYDLVVVGHQRTGHLRELVHDSVAPAVLEHAEGAIAVVPCHTHAAELIDGS